MLGSSRDELVFEHDPLRRRDCQSDRHRYGPPLGFNTSDVGGNHSFDNKDSHLSFVCLTAGAKACKKNRRILRSPSLPLPPLLH